MTGQADAGGTPFGRYRLVELLGRGGMGEVWQAYDPVNARYVALKLLPANFADDEVYQERFRREAHAAAGLDDPHVVPIYDSGEIDGRLFVSMMLIKGRDLEKLLEGGPCRRLARSRLSSRSPQRCIRPTRLGWYTEMSSRPTSLSPKKTSPT